MKTKAISILLVLVMACINVIGSIPRVVAQETDTEIKACIHQVLAEYGISIPEDWVQVSNGHVSVWIPTTEGLWSIIEGLNDALLTCTGMQDTEVWAGGKKLIYDMHHEGNDLVMVLETTSGPVFDEFMNLLQTNYHDLFLGVLYSILVYAMDGTTLFERIVDLVPIKLANFGPTSRGGDHQKIAFVAFLLLLVITVGVLLYFKRKKS